MWALLSTGWTRARIPHRPLPHRVPAANKLTSERLGGSLLGAGTGCKDWFAREERMTRMRPSHRKMLAGSFGTWKEFRPPNGKLYRLPISAAIRDRGRHGQSAQPGAAGIFPGIDDCDGRTSHAWRGHGHTLTGCRSALPRDRRRSGITIQERIGDEARQNRALTFGGSPSSRSLNRGCG
jgi:hypothetical protein